MSATKKDKCLIDQCDKTRRKYNGHLQSRYCSTHAGKATIKAFLTKMYRDMKARVTGTKKGAVADRSKHIYLGKPILPRDVFIQWAKNHPDFLSLYKRYVMNDFERRLAPSINRMDSKKGYTLDNMEWMTSGQNSGLAGTVTKMKNTEKKAIYKILGICK
jgi:hypothetical protein